MSIGGLNLPKFYFTWFIYYFDNIHQWFSNISIDHYLVLKGKQSTVWSPLVVSWVSTTIEWLPVLACLTTLMNTTYIHLFHFTKIHFLFTFWWYFPSFCSFFFCEEFARQNWQNWPKPKTHRLEKMIHHSFEWHHTQLLPQGVQPWMKLLYTTLINQMRRLDCLNLKGPPGQWKSRRYRLPQKGQKVGPQIQKSHRWNKMAGRKWTLHLIEWQNLWPTENRPNWSQRTSQLELFQLYLKCL